MEQIITSSAASQEDSARLGSHLAELSLSSKHSSTGSLSSMEDILSKYTDSEFQFRPLQRDDYERGIMQVLGQLTVVGHVTKESWEERFDWLFPKHADTYFIMVIVDKAKNSIVGSATLMLERKFLRSTGIVNQTQNN